MSVEDTKKFFADQVKTPQAWLIYNIPSAKIGSPISPEDIQLGYYTSFSVARDLYKRDEKEIKSLVSQYKLKIIDNGSGHVSFTKGIK